MTDSNSAYQVAYKASYEAASASANTVETTRVACDAIEATRAAYKVREAAKARFKIAAMVVAEATTTANIKAYNAAYEAYEEAAKKYKTYDVAKIIAGKAATEARGAYDLAVIKHKTAVREATRATYEEAKTAFEAETNSTKGD